MTATWDGPPRRLPRVLDVPAVMRRYGLRDARTARALMREAGALVAGRRLMVREDHLDAWECAQASRWPATAEHPQPVRRRRAGTRRVPGAAPLQPGWWRDPE